MSFSDLAAPSVVALVLVLSGCGGAGKSTVESASKAQGASTVSSTAETPTRAVHVSRAELIAKANEICRRTEARRAPLKLTSAADYATVLPQLAAYQRTMVAELRRLAPPPFVSGGWAQFLAQAGMLADDAAKVGEYAERNNLQAGHRFMEGFAAARIKLRTVARRVGFEGCAKF